MYLVLYHIYRLATVI